MKRLPRLPEIVSAVSAYYGIPEHHIHGRRRSQAIVRARHVVFWIARESTHFSLADIGRQINGSDHTTVKYGVNRVSTNGVKKEAKLILRSIRNSIDK